MVNNFGKFCRKLRIDHNELLIDMATKLQVSAAFLSKVENGKKKPPQKWRDIIVTEYELDINQIAELDEYIYEAQNSDSIDISSWEDEDKMLMLTFARKFESVDKKAFKKFLKNEVN